MIRRRVFLLGLLLTVLACLPVLGQGGAGGQEKIAGLPETINDGKPVEIAVFWLPSVTDAYDMNAKANVAVAQEFMKRYPNVKLKSFSFVKVPGAGTAIATDTDTLMSMAAGIAPDVLVVNFRQSDTFIRQGFLLPLDEFFQRMEQTPGGKEELSRLVPSPELWDVIKRPGRDGQTHVWTVPTSLLVGTVFYRKDLFRKAGLDPEKPPTNWDEFYQACLTISDPRPGKGTYGYVLNNSWYLTGLLWSAGSDILVRDPKKPTEWLAAYDDDAAVKAYQYAWKLRSGPWSICEKCDKPDIPPAKTHSHYVIDPHATEVTCPQGHHYTVKELKKKQLYFTGVCVPPTGDYWGPGKQAFNYGYMGDLQLNLGAIDSELIGVMRMPAGPDGVSRSELNSSMLGINGTLKDRARIEAAWAYIRFRTSEAAERLQAKVYVESGYAKLLNPAWLKRFGYDAYLRDVPAGWEQTFNEAVKHGRPEPYGKNAQKIYNEMDMGWDQVRMLPDNNPDKIRAILHGNVERTNERLIGIVPPAEKKKRDTVALILVIVTVILFGFLLKFVLNAYGQALDDPNARSKTALRRLITAWIVMLPAVVAVVLFQYYPLARGSTIAFQDYQILGGSKWVGLSNFGQVLFAPEFWNALIHSFQYAAIALGIGFFAPVILALLLHEIPRGSLFYRIVFYLPSITSGIVVMLLWTQLYDPTPNGMLNQVFALLHLPQQPFLQDPNLAMFWVVLQGVWAGMGPGCIIYLAAMRQIPEDYYEAADVDGAGFFAKLRMITIPYLKPLLIINFVGACVGAMKSFEPIWIMTGGGPAESTTVLGLEVYRNAFMYLRYGYATSMGWIIASLLIGFTIFQLRYLSKVQFRLAKSE